MKKAFTLIELLVVIAIIAILAAILFPVFAQAKEAAKKTSTLSNFKQYATSAAIYTADSDDNFPLAWSYDSAGTIWRWNFNTSVPNGWRNNGTHNVDPRKSEDGLFWANSMQSYVKNNQILAQNGLPLTSVAADPVVAGMSKTPMGISMNGLLHRWSATAIEQPSRIPLFWAGLGKQNQDGFGLTNPTLVCTAALAQGCMFNPAATGGAGAWFATGVVYTYGKGQHYAASDTSAKFRNIPTIVNPVFGSEPTTKDYYNNPYAAVTAAGNPVSMWFCGSFPCVFRPDQTN